MGIVSMKEQNKKNRLLRANNICRNIPKTALFANGNWFNFNTYLHKKKHFYDAVFLFFLSLIDQDN